MITFFKGRVALYAILKAIGIKSGDEIILPGFTCVVVANAINYLGARPIYVDINPETFNIDTAKLEELFVSCSSKLNQPKAIIAQHTFGIPAEMDKIMEIAHKHNLYVIEDSCHAIGSRYKGQEVGTFGDAAFFSSQWSKPVTTGLGGWAIVNNPRIRENMKKIYPEFIPPSYKEDMLLRLQYYSYSVVYKPSFFWLLQNTYRKLSNLGLAIGSSHGEELEYNMPIGYKKKMSQWQYKMLKRKLMDIKKINDHREWISLLYERLLKEKGIKTIELTKDYDPVYLRYPLLVEDKHSTIEGARKKRIEIGDWFLSPLHPNHKGWQKAGYDKGMCPIAEKICDSIINLPTHERVSNKDAKRIAEFIIESQYAL